MQIVREFELLMYTAAVCRRNRAAATAWWSCDAQLFTAQLCIGAVAAAFF